jgi:hypothetical protein
MNEMIIYMTPRQSFELYAICKVDIRNLRLTIGEASGFITRAQNDPVTVKNELIALGGVDKSNGKTPTVKIDYQKIFNEAHAAGLTAGNACRPTPMVVQNHANPLDDTSPVTKSYFVPSGVCGFASSVIKGNNGFVKWLRENKIGYKNYYGGWAVPCHDFNQSMECKESYCAAFSNVVSKYGFDAYMTSRMD